MKNNKCVLIVILLFALYNNVKSKCVDNEIYSYIINSMLSDFGKDRLVVTDGLSHFALSRINKHFNYDSNDDFSKENFEVRDEDWNIEHFLYVDEKGLLVESYYLDTIYDVRNNEEVIFLLEKLKNELLSKNGIQKDELTIFGEVELISTDSIDCLFEKGNRKDYLLDFKYSGYFEFSAISYNKDFAMLYYSSCGDWCKDVTSSFGSVLLLTIVNNKWLLIGELQISNAQGGI